MARDPRERLAAPRGALSPRCPGHRAPGPADEPGRLSGEAVAATLNMDASALSQATLNTDAGVSQSLRLSIGQGGPAGPTCRRRRFGARAALRVGGDPVVLAPDLVGAAGPFVAARSLAGALAHGVIVGGVLGPSWACGVCSAASRRGERGARP